ncbi:MAG: glutathione S-transferase family protein [Alphaproteobacteria bacterium]|nr:glutathione S-transferase family protein [Alphaproteobacteria bacterium]
MTLRIHGIPASRAIRPLWAATELGLDFEHVVTDYKGGGTRTPEFLTLNPNGHIPVVEDETSAGHLVVFESMACALYITRAHGQANGVDISCANLKEEGEALRWAFWSVTELEKDALTVLMHRMAMPETERKSDLAQAAEGRLRAPLKVLEGILSAQADQNHDYLCAARFTVADLCVASVAMWIKPAAALLDEFPLTAAWLKRCLDRPAHQAARKFGR